MEALPQPLRPNGSLASPNEEAAAVARLEYVSDVTPGIARARKGRGFAYRTPDGRPVRDAETLRRIRALAIPPAWRDVWICPTAEGHIQAVGRDARGRKQYRYHARWRAVRDEAKYERMVEFGRALCRIRRRVRVDLTRPGLPREKVLAAVVRLLELSLIRVGNVEYARHNRSFGLTTLRARHAQVLGGRVRFEFHGKGGKRHRVEVGDGRLARIVHRCRALPGQELFQYVDENGGRQTIDSSAVNAYVRQIAGGDFTAKDFRTWAGTVLAATRLRAITASGQTPRKRQVAEVVSAVAGSLGNTPAVCRKSYIHPAVLSAFLEPTEGPGFTTSGAARTPSLLRPEERAVLRCLERARRDPPMMAARTDSAIRPLRSVAARSS
jgi:DNA topoisomerase-1